MSKGFGLFFLIILLVLVNKIRPLLATVPESKDNECKNNEILIETLIRQNNNLTEKIAKLESVLDEIKSSITGKKEEDPSLFDSHFNCLRNCTNASRNCYEAAASNGFERGNYLLNLTNSNLKPFYANCFPYEDEEQLLTLIQRREDGSVNFNRNWADYKRGFGDLYGDFWIGLDRLHAMTTAQPHKLIIAIYDRRENSKLLIYERFVVGSEIEGYKLTLEGGDGENFSNFFLRQNGMKFSTYDKSSDPVFGQCARNYKAGWWYDSCEASNLNGPYRAESARSDTEGIKWTVRNFNTPIHATLMAIQPLS